MKKIMNKDNKGFSLIELIIVIAIMAVLIALIAPNLTKYLGSSKTTADTKNKDEVKKQVEACIADAATKDIAISGGTFTIKGDGSAEVTVSAGCDGTANTDGKVFSDLVKEALGKANTKSKVNASKDTLTVEIEVSTDGSNIFVKDVDWK